MCRLLSEHVVTRFTNVFILAASGFAWLSLALSLGFNLADAIQNHVSLAGVLGGFVSSFTILVSIMAALILSTTAMNVRRMPRPNLIASVAVYLLIVTLIYVLEFHGALETTGVRRVPDLALHFILPFVFLLFWILLVPKGSLTWRTPFIVVVFPLVYLAYMLLRGGLTGVYSYPFLDAGALGYRRVALNGAGLLGIYLLGGTFFTLADCSLGWLFPAVDQQARRF